MHRMHHTKNANKQFFSRFFWEYIIKRSRSWTRTIVIIHRQPGKAGAIYALRAAALTLRGERAYVFMAGESHLSWGLIGPGRAGAAAGAERVNTQRLMSLFL